MTPSLHNQQSLGYLCTLIEFSVVLAANVRFLNPIFLASPQKYELLYFLSSYSLFAGLYYMLLVRENAFFIDDDGGYLRIYRTLRRSTLDQCHGRGSERLLGVVPYYIT